MAHSHKSHLKVSLILGIIETNSRKPPVMTLRIVLLNITFPFFIAAIDMFDEFSCPSSEAYALCGSDCAEEYFECVIDCGDNLFCAGDCVRSEAACRSGMKKINCSI